jgi:adenosylhomocysteine nucleosidase
MKLAKIGVLGAMQQEIALLLQNMKNVQERNLGEGKGARTYWHGFLYGKDSTLVFSRWGKVASASTVTTLIDVAEVDLILFTGVAGAISLDLEIGDVVIGSQLMQHDLDARSLYGRYEVPQLDISRFSLRPEYIELATKSAERYLAMDLTADVPKNILENFGITSPKVRTGLIVTGDQLIADADLRNTLGREIPDALCVEMEGAAVAQVCHERDVPLIVVRTISDKADHHVDFVKFVDTVASHFTCGIVRQFITEV